MNYEQLHGISTGFWYVTKTAVMVVGGVAMMAVVYASAYSIRLSIKRQSEYIGGHHPWPRHAAKPDAELNDEVRK